MGQMTITVDDGYCPGTNIRCDDSCVGSPLGCRYEVKPQVPVKVEGDTLEVRLLRSEIERLTERNAALAKERNEARELADKYYPDSNHVRDSRGNSVLCGSPEAVERACRALNLFAWIQEHEASDGVIARRLEWANEAEKLIRSLVLVCETFDGGRAFLNLQMELRPKFKQLLSTSPAEIVGVWTPTPASESLHSAGGENSTGE